MREGLVLVSADDPSCWSSQNEQDNRYYARLANVPMFEPSNSQEAKDMTYSALGLSKELELPVILRSTTRISHTLSPVTSKPLKKGSETGNFIKDTGRFVMVPRNALVMHDKLLEKMEKALEISESSPYNKVVHEDGDVGLITSGASFNYAVEAVERLALRASILKLGMAFPLPSQTILSFIEKFDKIFVVEELEPILEHDVRSIGSSIEKKMKIFGKLTGHFPRSKEYSTRIVYDGLAKGLGLSSFQNGGTKAVSEVSTPSRPPVLCPGCPHRASFYILKTTLGKKIVYCTDIGCYALGIQPPLQVGDLLICMGASLGTASGVSRVQGEPAVAIVGDSTFFHASIPALVNAVYNNHRIIVVVLDNFTTAMTGFQPHPGVKSGELNNLMIEDVAKGCGVKYVEVVDPMNIEQARKIVKGVIGFKGPSVIVFRRACSIHEIKNGVRHSPYIISEEKCNNCLACVKALGCPAIHIEEDEVKISEVLCTGCGFCVHICPSKAIEHSK